MKGAEGKKGKEMSFSFFRLADREQKPRSRGLTEIRDMGLSLRQLDDLFEMSSDYIDILKMSSGTQRLTDREIVRKKIRKCHDNGIEVSTGGFLERVLLQGGHAVDRFLDEARSLEYDVVEISNGMAILSLADRIRLVKRVAREGFKTKPEVAQAYGLSAGEKVEVHSSGFISEIRSLLESGAWMVMIESEGLTENVSEWNTKVIRDIAASADTGRLMFEAADVEVFDWYIRTFGPDINLYIDWSQVNALEMVRTGLWGKRFSWGRVASYRE